MIHNEVNILVRHKHVTHRHYASVHNEQHHWAHFERVLNVHQRRYEAVLAEHMHLFMPDRSTRVNVRKTEAIFNNTYEYSHFTRNVSNLSQRSDLIGRKAALETSVQTAQTQMAELIDTVSQILNS